MFLFKTVIMKCIKLFFYFWVFIGVSMNLSAQEFSVDRIKYRVLYDKEQQVEVVGIEGATDTLVLLDYVVYNGKRYKVTDWGFWREYNFSVVRLPSTFAPGNFGMFFTEKIEVSEDNPYFTSFDGVLFSKDMKELVYYPNQRKDSSYIIPATVTQIDNFAFTACKFLRELTIPPRMTDVYAYCFNGKWIYSEKCDSLEKIHVAENNPYFYSQDGVLFEKKDGTTRLICYPIARKDSCYVVPEGVESIAEAAFMHCGFLKKLILPKSLKYCSWSAFISRQLQHIHTQSEIEMDNPYASKKSSSEDW